MRAALASVDIAGLGEDPSKFFEALDAADRRIAEQDETALIAPMAPPVTWFGSCRCGSVMEIRGDLTDDDYDAINDWTSLHADCEVH